MPVTALRKRHALAAPLQMTENKRQMSASYAERRLRLCTISLQPHTLDLIPYTCFCPKNFNKTLKSFNSLSPKIPQNRAVRSCRPNFSLIPYRLPIIVTKAIFC